MTNPARYYIDLEIVKDWGDVELWLEIAKWCQTNTPTWDWFFYDENDIVMYRRIIFKSIEDLTLFKLTWSLG